MNLFMFSPDAHNTATLSSFLTKYPPSISSEVVQTDSAFRGLTFGINNYGSSARLDRLYYLFPTGPLNRFGGGLRFKTDVNLQANGTAGTKCGWPITSFGNTTTNQVTLLMNLEGGVTVAKTTGYTVGGENISSADVIAYSNPGLIHPTSANHIGWEVTIDGSAGTIDIWVNGEHVIIGVTGVNTGPDGTNTVDRISFYPGGISSNQAPSYYRDLYINDFNGPDNIGYGGPLIVRTAYVNGVGRHDGMTPVGAALTSQAVSEHPNDGDTTYAQSTTPLTYSLFTIAAPAGITDIRAVQVDLAISNAGGAASSAAAMISDGSTDFLSPRTIYPPSSYLMIPTVFNRTATGSVWTSTALNALQIGVKQLS